MKLLTWKVLWRYWTYFRMGYGTYLSSMLGVLSTFTVLYYLAIDHVPILKTVFPSFLYFVVLSSVVGLPLTILIGHAHYKRIPAFSSDTEIQVEASPFTYRLQPGYWSMTFFPAMRAICGQVQLIGKMSGTLTIEQEAEFKRLDQEFDFLIKGGSLGKPNKSKGKSGRSKHLRIIGGQ